MKFKEFLNDPAYQHLLGGLLVVGTGYRHLVSDWVPTVPWLLFVCALMGISVANNYFNGK